MDFYTNQKSLEATFGIKEVEGLLQDVPGIESQVRLDKAALQAYSEINDYLGSGGYVTPLLFTPFGAEDVSEEDFLHLHGTIQGISDCFTAFHLSRLGDLNKIPYNDCRKEGLAWLERVRLGELRLTWLAAIAGVEGIGNMVVVARPSVFNKHLRREEDIFPGGLGGV